MLASVAFYALLLIGRCAAVGVLPPDDVCMLQLSSVVQTQATEPSDAQSKPGVQALAERESVLPVSGNEVALFAELSQQLDASIKISGETVEGNSNQFIEQTKAMNLLAADPRINSICQTGFNGGHSALRWLLHSKPDAKVYSFDLGSHSYSKPAQTWLASRFPGRHTITWGDSRQTIPAFKAANPNVKCNLIFVDGGHDHEVAIADLKNFMGMADPSYNVLMLDDSPCHMNFCKGPQGAWNQLLVSGDVAQTNAVTMGGGARGFTVGRYVVPGLQPSILESLDGQELYQQLDANMKTSGGQVEGNTNQFIEQTKAMNLLAADPRINSICQTGFNGGHSALRWLLNAKPDAKVYSFDIGSHSYSKPAHTLLESRFPGRHTITWGDSTHTIPAFKAANPNVKCNLVFVDGGHDYQVAIADLKNFMSMADPSYNVLMLDDHPCNGRFCMGPQQAWNEVLLSGDVVQTSAVPMAGGSRGFSVGRYVVPGAV